MQWLCKQLGSSPAIASKGRHSSLACGWPRSPRFISLPQTRKLADGTEMNTAEPRSLLTASGDAHAKGVGGTRPFATYQAGVTLRTVLLATYFLVRQKPIDCTLRRSLAQTGKTFSGNDVKRLSASELTATQSRYTYGRFALL